MVTASALNLKKLLKFVKVMDVKPTTQMKRLSANRVSKEEKGLDYRLLEWKIEYLTQEIQSLKKK